MNSNDIRSRFASRNTQVQAINPVDQLVESVWNKQYSDADLETIVRRSGVKIGREDFATWRRIRNSNEGNANWR